MANVKPGDLARIVGTDEDGNNGQLVEVLGLPETLLQFVAARMMAETFGDPLIWSVKLLGFAKGRVVGFGGPASPGPDRLNPGDICLIADRFLRRIDPGQEPDELWRDEPLEGEVNNQLKEKV